MTGGLLVLLLSCVVREAKAQIPHYTPPPMTPFPNGQSMNIPTNQAPDARRGLGSYQLKDGQWKEGKLVFDGLSLTVKSQGDEPKKVFKPEDLRNVVFAKDTFTVLLNFQEVAGGNPVPAAFVQRKLRLPEVEVLEWFHPSHWSFGVNSVKILRNAAGETVPVPQSKKEFKAFMIEWVKGDEVLQSKIQNNTYYNQGVEPILKTYYQAKQEKQTGQSN